MPDLRGEALDPPASKIVHAGVDEDVVANSMAVCLQIARRAWTDAGLKLQRNISREAEGGYYAAIGAIAAAIYTKHMKP